MATVETGVVTHSSDWLREGDASLSLRVYLGEDFSAANTLLACSADFASAIDLSAGRDSGYNKAFNAIGFWLRTSRVLPASKMSLIITDQSLGDIEAVGAVYTEFMIDQEIAAETWTYVVIYGDMSLLDAALSIGIYTTLDCSTSQMIVYIDDIRAFRCFGTGSDMSQTATPERFAHCVAMDNHTPPGWTASTALIISDGINIPTCWDGVDTYFEELAVNLTDFSGFTYTDELDFHYDHLLFGSFHDGTHRRNNIKWTAMLDVYGDDAWSTGTTGESFISMLRGGLMRSVPFDNYRVLYGASSIAVQTYIGGVLIYTFDEIFPSLGLLALKAVFSFVKMHAFMGSDANIYMYYGSKTIEDVGIALGDFLKDNIFYPNKNTIFFGYDTMMKRLYCFYPAKTNGDDVLTDDTYAQSYVGLDFNVSPPAWVRGRLAYPVSSMGEFYDGTWYTCDGVWAAGHDCDESPFSTTQCNEAGLPETIPSTLLLGTDGYAFLLDKIYGQDYNSNIKCVYETGDLIINDGTELQFFRPALFTFNATNKRLPYVSNTVTVEYSIDSGVTWTAFYDSPITLENEWTTHQLEFGDLVVQKLRVRFTEESNGDLQIAELNLQYSPSSHRE